MKQLKKTLLTLVALLAVTTGAWATEFTSLKVGDVLHVGDAINTGTNYKVYGLYFDAGNQPATLVRANIGTNDITESETGAYYLIKGKNDFYFGIIWGAEGLGGYWPVTDTSDGISVTAITPGDYTELTFAVHEGTASTVDIDWNAETKTGSFKMPSGNVTLEPEYYPQAALTAAPTAINDVPATTDGAIVKAGTVATIGSTETAQGTVMYYVSTTALDDAALLALAADQWKADVPTAEKLTKGEAYVYYYVRGNDSDTDEENFSDGDILAANALTVTIAPEPTYAVTFADDTAEPTLWKAEPATGVKKGQTVTVTYTGSKKVIGVKAEKKAAEPVADIVWDATNVFNSAHQFEEVSPWNSDHLTYEGITISFSGDDSFFRPYGGQGESMLLCYGEEGESFTFTAPSGKKFCKIEIINNSYVVFDKYGDWTQPEDNKIVWSGTAANAVTLGTVYTAANKLNSIAFYLSK